MVFALRPIKLHFGCNTSLSYEFFGYGFAVLRPFVPPMKHLVLILFALACGPYVDAGLLPGPESGNPKLLPGKNTSPEKVLPGGGTLPPKVNTGAKPLPSPANESGGGDFFKAPSRLRLTRLVASDEGDNSRATVEVGEPLHGGYEGNPGGKSLWWRYESKINGALILTTEGSNFDTTLSVYIGDTVDALTALAHDNNSGTNETSTVRVSVVAGVNYYIAVDGYNGASGKVMLNAIGIPTPEITTGGPINDNYADRIELIGNYVLDYGHNYNATGEDEDYIFVSDGSYAATVWWTWTAPSTGVLVVKTAGSDFNTYLGAVNITAGRSSFNDNVSKSDTSSIVTISVNAGDMVDITVTGQFQQEGFIVLALEHKPRLTIPSNDIFDFRRGFKGGSYSFRNIFNSSFDLIQPEIGEPNHAGANGYGSQWWTWTAPASGVAKVSAVAAPKTGTTPASPFKPLIGVYRGPRVSFLKLVDSAQDSDYDGKAAVSFDVRKGETYQFAVGRMPISDDGAYNFSLTLETGAPQIASQPKSANVGVGEDAVFVVKLSDSTRPPVEYRWQSRGALGGWNNLTDNGLYRGALTEKLIVKNVALTMDGARFRCVVKNASGSVTTEEAILSVASTPSKASSKKKLLGSTTGKSSDKLLGN